MKIVLDPGPWQSPFANEKQSLQLITLLSNLFFEQGYDTLMTRYGSSGLREVNFRTEIAAANHADIFLGIDVYRLAMACQAQPAMSLEIIENKRGKPLAALLRKQLTTWFPVEAARAGFNPPGWQDLAFPAALVRIGVAGWQREGAWLVDPAIKSMLAWLLVEGVKQYVKVKA